MADGLGDAVPYGLAVVMVLHRKFIRARNTSRGCLGRPSRNATRKSKRPAGGASAAERVRRDRIRRADTAGSPRDPAEGPIVFAWVGTGASAFSAYSDSGDTPYGSGTTLLCVAFSASLFCSSTQTKLLASFVLPVRV